MPVDGRRTAPQNTVNCGFAFHIRLEAMKITLFALSVAALTLATPAAAAVTDLWALDQKSGEPANYKGFPNKQRIYSVDEHEKLNDGLKKSYSQRVVYCNQEFMISTAVRRWISAQEKAGHRVVLRERLPKGQNRNVC